jgi:AraC-like DNA-binding protein
MQRLPKAEQKRPLLPVQHAPVRLPEDFPFVCGPRSRQTDRPITFLHRHDVPEIGYCHSGSGIWIVEGKILTFSAGDVILITQDEMHLAQSSKGTVSEWTWIYCDPARLFTPFLRDMEIIDLAALSGPAFRNIYPCRECPQVSAATAAIVEEFREPGSRHAAVATGMLYTLLALLRRHAVFSAPARGRNRSAEHRADLERVRPAVEHMCRHYGATVTIADLAQRSCMSVTNFRRVFGRVLGRSPLDYLSSLRVSMAAAALRSSDRKVAAIAQECGFPTLSSFNRMFRQVTGATPRGWRKGGGS